MTRLRHVNFLHSSSIFPQESENKTEKGRIPNPVVPCSKPLGGSKVDSAFHPSEIGKMSTRNFWELTGKSKLPPRSGSSLEVVEPHPEKGAIKFKV